MIPDVVGQLIRMALAEDVGAGDITSRCFVSGGKRAGAAIIAKEPGVMAGIEVAREVFRLLDPDVLTLALRADGDAVQRGDAVITLEGPARSILTGERTALNFLQRLSGIATQTRRYVEAVKGYPVKIMDTRKTTPGWRWLEKMAVRAGGGTNHRAGLYDMVMVKDNHLQAAGDLAELQAGIDRAQAAQPGVRVEIEADSADQVRAFLTLRGVAVIMLDNMSPAEMRDCVALARGSGVPLEASGGVTLARLPEIAATGVDLISSGALTHSAQALDLSLDFEGRSL